MALREKYSELITAAYAAGVLDLRLKEQNGILHINGIAPSEQVKQRLFELHNKLLTNHQTRELVLDIKVDGMN